MKINLRVGYFVETTIALGFLLQHGYCNNKRRIVQLVVLNYLLGRYA